jgi:hypothetical protein
MHRKFVMLHSSEQSHTHCTGFNPGHSVHHDGNEGNLAAFLCGQPSARPSALRTLRARTCNVRLYGNRVVSERVCTWLTRLVIVVVIIFSLGQGSNAQAQGLPDVGGAARSIADAPGQFLNGIGQWWNGLLRPPPPPPPTISTGDSIPKKISRSKPKKQRTKLIRKSKKKKTVAKRHCKGLSEPCNSDPECCSGNCANIGGAHICN